jgi:hypothetical protein
MQSRVDLPSAARSVSRESIRGVLRLPPGAPIPMQATINATAMSLFI